MPDDLLDYTPVDNDPFAGQPSPWEMAAARVSLEPIDHDPFTPRKKRIAAILNRCGVPT